MSSPAPSPPSRLRPSTAPLPIHTYHCLCSTLLLATPYHLSSLPTRAPPARDQARILPLPRFRNHSDGDEEGGGDDRTDELEPANADDDDDDDVDAAADGSTAGKKKKKKKGAEANPQAAAAAAPRPEPGYLPSLLLPALRPARKITLVQREDGYERRRVWRCGRCGVGIGYEVEKAEGKGGGGGEDEERVRVMFVLEGGLVETESMLLETGDGKEFLRGR